MRKSGNTHTHPISLSSAKALKKMPMKTNTNTIIRKLDTINRSYTTLESTEQFTPKQVELHRELIIGIHEVIRGNTRPFAEAMADVKVKRSK